MSTKTYTYECPKCGGDGGWEAIDFRRVTFVSVEPPLRWQECPRCKGAKTIEVDEDAEGVICGIREQHRHDRQADHITIEAQHAQIASLEALLRAERDRNAALERRAS